MFQKYGSGGGCYNGLGGSFTGKVCTSWVSRSVTRGGRGGGGG